MGLAASQPCGTGEFPQLRPWAKFFESQYAYLYKGEDGEEQTLQNVWALYATLAWSSPHARGVPSSPNVGSTCR